MSDLTTGYLLGQIAESHFKGLEETAVSVMTSAKTSQQRIDIHALMVEIQELRHDNAYLRDDIARLERNIERLQSWGNGLATKLDKLRRS